VHVDSGEYLGVYGILVDMTTKVSIGLCLQSELLVRSTEHQHAHKFINLWGSRDIPRVKIKILAPSINSTSI
jgi:hypothetical protein